MLRPASASSCGGGDSGSAASAAAAAAPAAAAASGASAPPLTLTREDDAGEGVAVPAAETPAGESPTPRGLAGTAPQAPLLLPTDERPPPLGRTAALEAAASGAILSAAEVSITASTCPVAVPYTMLLCGGWPAPLPHTSGVSAAASCAAPVAGDCRAVAVGDMVYAMGGAEYFNNTDPAKSCADNWVNCYRFLKSVEAFDPVSKKWSSRAPMISARGDFGIDALPGGRIIVAGGERGNGTQNQIALYDGQPGGGGRALARGREGASGAAWRCNGRMGHGAA
ncbi:hypothetical protein TSOC_013309 [Tetrabaena socialis]|uniref:Uncharacterized protein n=1 Tax=Tetrabaena socialis TaxID=47790 RepID=A0A2J7ZKP9_9CHLO|nr:hypothetical protein TSOC_013309 [Tetrabaena socialis]|eukprot:PNH00845.1 hypothetical protein TSOC_013309 [Tetrabaena socialis]